MTGCHGRHEKAAVIWVHQVSLAASSLKQPCAGSVELHRANEHRATHSMVNGVTHGLLMHRLDNAELGDLSR